MPRRFAALVLLGFGGLGLAGCSPNVRDGWYGCTSPAECPSGFTCQGGRCSRGVSMGTECRVDANCDDVDACTLDICEGGLCVHEPQSGECDDADFCNGPDECRAGVCTNVGPAPCEPCAAVGCGACGALFMPCCDGLCFEGACDGLSCQSCGATGEACCPGDFPCAEPAATCDGATCVGCGTLGAPCCGGGLCDSPMICLPGSTCGEDPACSMVACASPQVCVAGVCSDCGGAGSACCADGSCLVGTCNPATRYCEVRSCGAEGQSCCGSVPECDRSLACVTPDVVGGGPVAIGTCQLCGAVGEPCCPPPSGMAPCRGLGVTCDFGLRTCTR